jgi:hypothetical protein
MRAISDLFTKYTFTSTERFLRYVQIDTQSDPYSETSPSSEKQKELGRVLVDELKTTRSQTSRIRPIRFCLHVYSVKCVKRRDAISPITTKYSNV